VNNNLYVAEEKHAFVIFQILQLDKIVIENYIKKVYSDIPDSFLLKCYYTFVLLYLHLVDIVLIEHCIFVFSQNTLEHLVENLVLHSVMQFEHPFED